MNCVVPHELDHEIRCDGSENGRYSMGLNLHGVLVLYFHRCYKQLEPFLRLCAGSTKTHIARDINIKHVKHKPQTNLSKYLKIL